MPRPPASVRLPCLILIPLLALLPPAGALARQDAAPVQAAAEDFLREQARAVPGEASVSVTPPAADNHLAPCAALEAFLPPGARAWGRTMVGVRCTSGASWTLYLHGQVKVTGHYLAAAHPLRPGQPVRPEDLEVKSGDLSQLPAGILTEPDQATGRLPVYGIAAGQPLKGDMLRQAPAVQKGQNVTVFSRGEGFQVSTEGVALNDAAPGQVVQVRLLSGQVRSGIARAGGLVEMNY